MEALFIVSIFGAFCFLLGWHAREYHATRVISRAMEEFTEDTIAEFKAMVITIKVEEDSNGDLFVYRKDDGSYLAHGKTKKQLEDILNEKFPGKLFNATGEDMEKLKSK
jgi:hypothetical protein